MNPIAFPNTLSLPAQRLKLVYYTTGILLSVAIAWQQFALGSYNNFTIFTTSFQHLQKAKNLYLLYPEQYNDLFLYNPSFAVLFAPFSALPTLPSMMLWAVLSMCFYLFSIAKLAVYPPARLFILAVSLPDCINSLQHQQVNHVSLALMILVLVQLRSGNQMLAALCTIAAFYVKVYPAAIGLCFLFFPNKLRYLFWCLAWAVVFFALPLLFIPFGELAAQYQNWFASLLADRTVEENATSLSLISMNYQWLSRPINPSVLQGAGLVLMLLPLVCRSSLFGVYKWQLLYVAGLLLFVIIFNHAAESATYLLAVTGVALWYICSPKTLINSLLLAFVLLFTVLTVTDLVPSSFKNQFIHPYSIRAVPCVLVWVKIMFQLLNPPFQDEQTSEPVNNRIAAV